MPDRLRTAVAAFRLKVDDQFSGWAIDGALRALADNENPLRLNFFSTEMRILCPQIHALVTASATCPDLLFRYFERVRLE
jgi:hypothetical protein